MPSFGALLARFELGEYRSVNLAELGELREMSNMELFNRLKTIAFQEKQTALISPEKVPTSGAVAAVRATATAGFIK